MEKATFLFLSLCGLLALVFSVPTTKVGPREAPSCPANPDLCQLPSCRCSSQAIPGDLVRLAVPQIVYLTFDDAITVTNHPFYDEVFTGRVNPNGASISATFFITHEYTNYSMVHDLWRKGHDIALHSITHVSDTGYWTNLNVSQWRAEIVNQRDQIAEFARIPRSDIQGMRAPFLQVGGDDMYEALVGGGFSWECSRPTQNQRVPGLWPYTNDYASTQDCQITPCPVESYPGFWTVPMIDLIGEDQFPCAMVDECTPVPMTSDDTFNLLERNFLDQYDGNRAPFGVFTHAAWLVGPDDRPEFAQRKDGYIRFLDYLSGFNDVHIVGISKSLEWVKNPTPWTEIDDLDAWDPQDLKNNSCTFPRNCRYENGTWERYMSSCIPCPPNYPWLENPMGTLTLEY